MNPHHQAPHGHAQAWGQPPMMAPSQGQIQSAAFKFTFVRGANAATVFAKDGVVTAQGLLLDGMPLPLPCIQNTETRLRRIIITLAHPHMVHPSIMGFVEEGCLVLEVRSPLARTIEMAIDRFASSAEAEAKRQALYAQGRGHEFRVLACPFCHATVDLSSLPPSGYYYCRFCTSVHHHQLPLPQTTHYRACDECSMFDRNQPYLEFYFYFLFIVYGFTFQHRNMCDNCARGLFWKTFLINFIFVLGVPSALWVLVKSKIGREPSLQSLADANQLALAGDLQRARAHFAALHRVLPDHPGLHVNEARGHARVRDVHAAMASLQAALASCPNYVPAHEWMRKLHAEQQPPAWPAQR